MTRSRTLAALAAATIGLALAGAPAAFADDMSPPGAMGKSDTMGKTNDGGMNKNTMSTGATPTGGMSHDGMSHDGMKKDETTK